MDKDKETTELKSLMEVIPDKEEVAVDAIPLATKPPSIVDWKIHKEGKKSYYQIIRADGSSKIPVEDLDLVLYGDLKTMFDPHVKDQVWKNQPDTRKNIKVKKSKNDQNRQETEETSDQEKKVNEDSIIKCQGPILTSFKITRAYLEVSKFKGLICKR
ncbi:hypothetical protein Tco_0290685 [Tanacetum coccineum]